MTDPQQRNAVIITQSVTAERLVQLRGHLPSPLLVSDGDEKTDPDGWPTTCSRLVSNVQVRSGSDSGDRQQVVVEFLDGTPGRVFDPDDMVEVHNIVLGVDITEGFGVQRGNL